MTRMWFRQRSYGWGWFPITIEGWLIVLALIGWFIYISSKVETYTQEGFIIRLAIAILLLIIIGYLKGPRPKWHWGRIN